MKLEIESGKMKIITETVQDVSYLKHMGYFKDNPKGIEANDIMALNCVVHRIWDDGKEKVEISIYWREMGCQECSGDPTKRKFIQCALSENPTYHGI